MMVGANISTEQLVSIAERTVLEADLDKVPPSHGIIIHVWNCLPFQDELISFEEFARVLEKTDVEQKMSIRFLN